MNRVWFSKCTDYTEHHWPVSQHLPTDASDWLGEQTLWHLERGGRGSEYTVLIAWLLVGGPMLFQYEPMGEEVAADTSVQEEKGNK